MEMRNRSRAATVWLGVLAAVVVTVALAPLMTAGWCADADESGTSTCGSYQTSLVGIETTVWLWLAAVVIVIVVTVLIARPRGALS